MNEKLLQYIWQYQLFNKASLVTTEDDPIKIFKPGVINHNQGPDFSNALIKIDQEIWAGNIEIHINSTDWKRHQHVLEDHYDTIILHVVWNHDQDLSLPFPTLELKTLVPKLLIEKYTLLQQNESFIPCEKQGHSISFITLEKFKESLIAERLQQKSNDVLKVLNKVNGDWEEVAWQVICKNMGGKVNGEAFESIAKILSFKLLSKYRYQPIYIEALLLGMAGLIEPNSVDVYEKELNEIFQHLKIKHQLTELKCKVSFLRMRPYQFPTIRLSQLAMLVLQQEHLFSTIIELKPIKVYENLFHVSASKYWDNHYCFDVQSKFQKKIIGKNMINNFMINTLSVLLYAYGFYHKEEKYIEAAVAILIKIPAEKNKTIEGFKQIGFNFFSAYDTQAFHQLKNKYCNELKCLNCTIGHQIFRNPE